MFNNRTITKFEELTDFKLNQFLIECNSFFQNDYPLLYNFYSGKLTINPVSSVDRYKSLKEQVVQLFSIFKTSEYLLNTCEYWEVYDFIDDLNVKFSTINKLSKWLRSSQVNSTYTQQFSIDYVLNNGMSVEEAVSTMTGNENEIYANKLMIDNDLDERDYDLSGGQILKIQNQKTSTGVDVTTIVDSTEGEKIYGLDLAKKLAWENDDLKVLSYKDTLLQTIEICSKLVKGQIPEFKDKGMDINIGKSIGVLTQTMIARQFKANFNSDDLFKSVDIDKLIYNQGDITIEFKVKLVDNSVVKNNILL